MNETPVISPDVIVNSRVGGENQKIKLAILIASIGLILFIIITLTFSFKEPIFSALFPKPQSLAAPQTQKTATPSATVKPLGKPAGASGSALPKVSFEGAKRAFLTSVVYDGNLGGLKGADNKCQLRADSLNMGGTWKAWLSDEKTSAASRLNHFNGPFKMMDGTVVADNWNDLVDGVLKSPINIDEYGYSAAWSVWTNTKPDGTVSSNEACLNWTSNISYLGRVGTTSYQDQRWTSYSSSTCNYTRRLYCLEQ